MLSFLCNAHKKKKGKNDLYISLQLSQDLYHSVLSALAESGLTSLCAQ